MAIQSLLCAIALGDCGTGTSIITITRKQTQNNTKASIRCEIKCLGEKASWLAIPKTKTGHSIIKFRMEDGWMNVYWMDGEKAKKWIIKKIYRGLKNKVKLRPEG